MYYMSMICVTKKQSHSIAKKEEKKKKRKIGVVHRDRQHHSTGALLLPISVCNESFPKNRLFPTQHKNTYNSLSLSLSPTKPTTSAFVNSSTIIPLPRNQYHVHPLFLSLLFCHFFIHFILVMREL